ncbi:DMT family transporter [Cohnella thailandensis]|jgi:Membrane transporters of cations and cationic drugs|uniref:Multidrug efflux SMR transporter n=1 Tax=Cohnella thailandensis TaxID=557557 RepID=A0A841SRL4_9BACL|nr:multidrug efflux SMR transporter [Cohnella thailandensis]MBB6632540.1 multidrug efflux SMR transporter [Cohnella thailandensis]MBP1971834.1 paired small multidrug resistance pump [Cohnella thailandensis]
MNKYWLLLIVAGISEVGWVSGLKHANSWWTWALTAIVIFFSFYALILVTKVLPVGTTYAVFTGIGAAGTVLGESIFFGEPLSWGKLALVVVMIIGIAGLKITAGHSEPAAKEAN